MPKLFIVVNVDWFFLSHRKDIALSAQKRGYDVTIVTANTGKLKEIEKLGLKTIDLPMNRTRQSILKELYTCLFLYQLYKKERPDIVHHVGLKTILWGGLAAKFSKVNGVVNAISGLGIIFSLEDKSVFSGILIKILRFIHHRKNLNVIFQNNEDKAFFIENRIIAPNQAKMIRGSGVDLNEFQYTPEPDTDKIRIILTARMVYEKGIFDLIDAAHLLKGKYNNKIQFLICGGIDANPKAIKQKELETACDGDYIQWLGHRTDIFELLKSSHIVSLPSYYKEGIPKSLIEATAIGRPIVTTNSIGCKETVIDGYNGYLVPIKDSKSLAAKLSVLIESKELREQMGINSRKLAEKEFSINFVVDKHLELYATLMKKTT